MKPKQKGIKWVKRNLVVSPYCIGLCIREKDFKQELKRLKIPYDMKPKWISDGSDAKVHFFKKTDGYNPLCIVCIGNRKGRTLTELMGLIVHESVHVWQQIERNIGEYESNSEFESYSIQHISQYLIDAWKKGEKK